MIILEVIMMKVDCVTEAMEEQFNAGKNEGK